MHNLKIQQKYLLSWIYCVWITHHIIKLHKRPYSIDFQTFIYIHFNSRKIKDQGKHSIAYICKEKQRIP